MYLLWVGSGPGNENGIKTTAEPVGEGGASGTTFYPITSAFPFFETLFVLKYVSTLPVK
jgi:hypothetical protein